jgi:hypothetical protein
MVDEEHAELRRPGRRQWVRNEEVEPDHNASDHGDDRATEGPQAPVGASS